MYSICYIIFLLAKILIKKQRYKIIRYIVSILIMVTLCTESAYIDRNFNIINQRKCQIFHHIRTLVTIKAQIVSLFRAFQQN